MLSQNHGTHRCRHAQLQAARHGAIAVCPSCFFFSFAFSPVQCADGRRRWAIPTAPQVPGSASMAPRDVMTSLRKYTSLLYRNPKMQIFVAGVRVRNKKKQHEKTCREHLKRTPEYGHTSVLYRSPRTQILIAGLRSAHTKLIWKPKPSGGSAPLVLCLHPKDADLGATLLVRKNKKLRIRQHNCRNPKTTAHAVCPALLPVRLTATCITPLHYPGRHLCRDVPALWLSAIPALRRLWTLWKVFLVSFLRRFPATQGQRGSCSIHSSLLTGAVLNRQVLSCSRHGNPFNSCFVSNVQVRTKRAPWRSRTKSSSTSRKS